LSAGRDAEPQDSRIVFRRRDDSNQNIRLIAPEICDICTTVAIKVVLRCRRLDPHRVRNGNLDALERCTVLGRRAARTPGAGENN